VGPLSHMSSLSRLVLYLQISVDVQAIKGASLDGHQDGVILDIPVVATATRGSVNGAGSKADANTLGQRNGAKHGYHGITRDVSYASSLSS